MEIVPGLHWVERIWDTKVYILVEESRVVIIDAAMPGRAQAVWRHLTSLSLSPQDVDEIWLTHGDIDHMGSVATLKESSGARVIAHSADVQLVEGLADRALGPLPLTNAFQRIFNWAVKRILRYQPTVVDQVVEDGDDLGGWRVVHAPGHTAGSICFHQPERGIIIVGDAINHKRGRLGAPPLVVAPDLSQAYASIQKIADLDFEVCCFGHGPPLVGHAKHRVRVFADSLPL
jgi:glyoxylase-like metal-dependent hydrolase (beta-lactamase superfamily II)